MQVLDRLCRGFLDRIRNAQETGRLSVHGNEHHGLAVLPQVLGLCLHPAGIDAKLVEQRAIAERYCMSVNPADDTFPGLGLKFPGILRTDALFLGTGHDGRRKRVFDAGSI